MPPRNKNVLFDQATDGTGASAGGSAGAGAAGDAGGNPAQPASGGGASTAASVLASAGAAGAAAAGTGTQPQDWLPEKYRVAKEDGSIDTEASARKLSDAYRHLEQKLGAGEVPPKTADEYAPKVEVEGFNWDEFKADPLMQSFLKGAHAKGITNDQLSFVLGEYMQRVPELVQGAGQLDEQAATAELKKTWTTDQDFSTNVSNAFKAFNAFVDPADKDKIDEIGNNPIVLRLLARIGKELQEDSPVGGGAMNISGFDEQIAALRADPAYTDRNHPQHKIVLAKVTALYEKKHGTKKHSLGGGATITT